MTLWYIYTNILIQLEGQSSMDSLFETPGEASSHITSFSNVSLGSVQKNKRLLNYIYVHFVGNYHPYKFPYPNSNKLNSDTLLHHISI